MTGEVVLHARGLCVSYGTTRVLDGAEIELRAGETLAVVGESGSGKSTLALALLGLLPPAAREVRGELSLGGRTFDAARPQSWASSRGVQLGFVGQDTQAAFDPLAPVGVQIAEVLRARELDAVAAEARARQLLAEVGLPPERDLSVSLPERLSGGERQRAQVAAALAGDPRILIADEPTSALDPATAAELLELLERLKRARGLALLWISHDLRFVESRAERVAVLHRGRIVETGVAREVLRSPQHEHTRELVAALPCGAAAPAAAVTAAPALRVSALSVAERRRGSFEARRAAELALEAIELQLAPGEITALIGASGAGKSTLLRALLGLEPGARGEVEIALAAEKLDLLRGSRSDVARARRAIGWIPQDPGGALDPRASVRESVAELLDDTPASSRAAAADALLRDCGLDARLGDRLPHELSGGERQRAQIARALAQEPRVLLLDEPTSSLDPSVAARVVLLLRELVARRGLCALWVTHDVALARSVAQRVLVLDAGRLVESGRVEDVLAQPTSPAARRLVLASQRDAVAATP